MSDVRQCWTAPSCVHVSDSEFLAVIVQTFTGQLWLYNTTIVTPDIYFDVKTLKVWGGTWCDHSVCLLVQLTWQCELYWPDVSGVRDVSVSAQSPAGQHVSQTTPGHVTTTGSPNSTMLTLLPVILHILTIGEINRS